MARGLSNVPQGGGGGGDFIKTIRLSEDQESCRIRFLTDADEFYSEWQHAKEVRGKFKGWVVCSESALSQPCEGCDNDWNSQLQFFAWVYEFYHDYTDKGPGRELITEGRRKFYREQVNEPRLLRLAGAHKGAFEIKTNKYGTLLDREYDLIRTGEKGSTRPQYSLEPSEDGKSSIPKELAEIAAELPDLEDVALNRVESLAKKEREKAPWVKADEEDKAERASRKNKVEEEDGTKLPF